MARKDSAPRFATAVDLREFVRFVAAGLTSAAVNLTAVGFARKLLSFDTALLVGLVAGLTTSFLLSKLFAFRSPSWDQAGREVVKFLTIYGTGCVFYWLIAVALRRFLLAGILPSRAAELVAVLGGSAVMMLTSYFGHRFYTYRSVLYSRPYR
jgi:putative flippase GtrA